MSVVRSTIKPGPFEGQGVLDREGRRLGVVEELNVQGVHVASILVRLDDGRVKEVPRDWFLETVREGIVLQETADNVRGLGERDAG